MWHYLIHTIFDFKLSKNIWLTFTAIGTICSTTISCFFHSGINFPFTSYSIVQNFEVKEGDKPEDYDKKYSNETSLIWHYLIHTTSDFQVEQEFLVNILLELVASLAIFLFETCSFCHTGTINFSR